MDITTKAGHHLYTYIQLTTSEFLSIPRPDLEFKFLYFVTKGHRESVSNLFPTYLQGVPKPYKERTGGWGMWNFFLPKFSFTPLTEFFGNQSKFFPFIKKIFLHTLAENHFGNH